MHVLSWKTLTPAQHPPVTPCLATRGDALRATSQCAQWETKLTHTERADEVARTNVLTFASAVGAYTGVRALTPVTSKATNLLNKHQHVFIFYISI